MKRLLGIAILAVAFSSAAYAGDVACVGDCNNSGDVDITEVLTGIGIGLDELDLDECEAADGDGDGIVEVHELVGGVDANVSGVCVGTGEPTPTPTLAETPTPTETVGPDGPRVCNFEPALEAGSTLQICFLGVCAEPLGINGRLNITCDPATQDENGKRVCQCELQNIGPIILTGIGTICVTPFAGPCPEGEIDCDGGNALDVDLVAEHSAGVCTGNADCASQCATYCSGISKAVYNSGCEGFCQGGSRADGACICDTAGTATCSGGVPGENDCPLGSCEGKDNDSQTQKCHCSCVDEAFGGASIAGSLSCRTGVSINVEALEDGICDGNVIIRLPGQCAPFVSTTSTGVINNFQELPGTLGPYSETGAAGTCAVFDEGTTTAYELVSVLAFYDSTVGDILSRLRINCL